MTETVAPFVILNNVVFAFLLEALETFPSNFQFALYGSSPTIPFEAFAS